MLSSADKCRISLGEAKQYVGDPLTQTRCVNQDEALSRGHDLGAVGGTASTTLLGSQYRGTVVVYCAIRLVSRHIAWQFSTATNAPVRMEDFRTSALGINSLRWVQGSTLYTAHDDDGPTAI